MCESRGLPDHWYPSNDIKKRARIDAYLNWHAAGIRQGVHGYFFGSYLSGVMRKKWTSTEEI